MSGRGRSRKAKSPDAEHAKRKTRADIKEASLPRHPDFTERQKQKNKKEEQKNPNNAEEKLPLESAVRERTANHHTEELNKRQSKSADSTTAETCATRTKLTENPPVVKMKTTKDSPKTRRAKTGSGRAKSQERLAKEETPTGIRKTKTSVKKAKSPEMFPEEMTKTSPDTPKDTTGDDDEKTGKAKACGTKPILGQFPEQVAKNTRETSEKTTEEKICAHKANSPKELRKMPKTPPRKCEDFTKDMTSHCTEELSKHQSKSADSTTAETCATRTKLTENPPVVKMKTTKDSPKTRRAKTGSGRAKSQERLAKEETPTGIRKTKTSVKKAKSPEMFPEEMTKTSPDTPKDTTGDDDEKTGKAKACGTKPILGQFPEQVAKNTRETSEKTTEEKICAHKANSPKELRKMPKTPPRKCEDFTKDMTSHCTEELSKHQSKSADSTTAETCATRTKLTENPSVVKMKTTKDSPKTRRAKTEVDRILKETLEKLKIKKNDRSEAASIINTIKQNIIKHLKEKTESFKNVQEPLPTGSYYENLKICNPDEFDIMVPISVDRVNIQSFGDGGAFYSVALKRDSNPLKKFQENDHLSASKMLSEFREEVKKCVTGFKEWKVEKKKKGCPAVTLMTNATSVPISLDVVLCLMVNSSWPPLTNEGLKINGWLGSKVKQDYKRMAYYLVPKYEGRGTVENDGVLNKDAWRISFSHVEKDILKKHGSEKTCCEKDGANCCRKPCLKLLKYLLQLLKERDSSFDKFCSYHAKTTLLHACCSRTRDSDWKLSDLSHCFQLLLKDFENYLNVGKLQNFFIPSQNLLSGISVQACNKLSRTIGDERLKGFPIFRKSLQNAH